MNIPEEFILLLSHGYLSIWEFGRMQSMTIYLHSGMDKNIFTNVRSSGDEFCTNWRVQTPLQKNTQGYLLLLLCFTDDSIYQTLSGSSLHSSTDWTNVIIPGDERDNNDVKVKELMILTKKQLLFIDANIYFQTISWRLDNLEVNTEYECLAQVWKNK